MKVNEERFAFGIALTIFLICPSLLIIILSEFPNIRLYFYSNNFAEVVTVVIMFLFSVFCGFLISLEKGKNSGEK